MPGITRGTIDTAGGGALIASQSFVRIDGQPIARVGDVVTDHGSGSHNSATLATGSLIVRIQGVPVGLAGLPASCGHAPTGSLTVSAAV